MRMETGIRESGSLESSILTPVKKVSWLHVCQGLKNLPSHPLDMHVFAHVLYTHTCTHNVESSVSVFFFTLTLECHFLFHSH